MGEWVCGGSGTLTLNILPLPPLSLPCQPASENRREQNHNFLIIEPREKKYPTGITTEEPTNSFQPRIGIHYRIPLLPPLSFAFPFPSPPPPQPPTPTTSRIDAWQITNKSRTNVGHAKPKDGRARIISRNASITIESGSHFRPI